MIGLGELPTVTAAAARSAARATCGAHDTLLSVVHWIWFLVPHGTLAYILLRHREQFERSAVLMAAVFDLGVLVYWLVPTAPPWWAGQQRRRMPPRAADHGRGGRAILGKPLAPALRFAWQATPLQPCPHSTSAPQ